MLTLRPYHAPIAKWAAEQSRAVHAKTRRFLAGSSDRRRVFFLGQKRDKR